MIKLADLLSEANDLKVYHKSYTEAIQTAKEYALKKGYMVDDDDSFRKTVESRIISIASLSILSLLAKKNGTNTTACTTAAPSVDANGV